jgi:hypothetical protein
MKLKANDTLHVSSVGPENIAPGAEFEVSDDMGRQLVEMGRATEVKSAKHKAEKDEVKQEPAPLNKMDVAPANKSKHKKGK